MERNRFPPATESAVSRTDPIARSTADAMDVGRWWQRGVRNGTAIGGLVVVAILLLNTSDIVAIAAPLRDLPAAIAISAAVHLPQILMTALAWRTLVPCSVRPSAGTMLLLRWYRESAGTLLPAGGLVGQVAAARLLMRSGVTADLAGATATIDLTLEVVAQVFFTLSGLALLSGRGSTGGMDGLAGLAVAASCAMALLAVQWLPRLRWVGARLEPLASRWPALRLHRFVPLYRAVRRLHAQPRTLASGFCWHGAAWAFGALEIVGVLGLLGRSVSFADGLIVESVAQALRNVGFMLPGAIGVQEAALIGAGMLVGIPSAQSLAVALVRRARELLMGVAGLLAWHRSEATWRKTGMAAGFVPGQENG